MADPLSASHLIAEDTHASRGFGPEEQQRLVDEVRELEDATAQAGSKGKGKARAFEADEGEHANGGPGNLNGNYDAYRPRRPSSSSGSSGSSTARRYSNHAAGVGMNADYDRPDGHRSNKSIRTVRIHEPKHSKRQRGRRGTINAAQDLLNGFLEDKQESLEPATKRELRSAFWRRMTINALFALAWYACSTLISLYNKWMFSPQYYNFGFPLFVTACHMAVQFALCSIVLTAFPTLRPKMRPSMQDWSTKAVPCGVATGLDIGLSNLSLKVITLTFYTMCKSSVLGFVLLFAFLFKLEKPTIPLISIIAVITAGVIMMVSGETQFHLWGMLEVLTASCLSGLRWSLTQILLDKEQMGMNNPFATLFWLAPVMGVVLSFCSLVIEGPWAILTSGFFDGVERILVTVLVILLPGCIAFSMNVAEFALIKRTSVVTLSVLGIFKEVMTICLSTFIFKDQLTPINVSGLAVALCGIIGFNYLKFRKYQNMEREALAGAEVGSMAGSFDEEGSAMMMRNGDYAPAASRDVEGQFQLVGESDLDSSDSEDEEDGKRDGIEHLPTYASTHPTEAQIAETRDLENKVQRDPMLVDIERENEQLELEMERDLHRIDHTKRD